MALTLTQYSSQLAAQLDSRRRFKNTQGEESGVQRIGHLTSNAGQTYTLYYDPSADVIFYDTGTPVLSQE